jgi:uroporphyrinogen-III synthase
MSLSGLRILNTRPVAQAQALSADLQATGAVVLEFPLLEILPRELSAEENRLLLDLDRYDGVFFVSANAAHYGLDAVAGFWPQWPHPLDVFATGEGSAKKLREAGLTVTVPASADSEGLLALPELQDVAGKKFLIMRGSSGRELLCDTLRQRGATVDVLALYQRLLPQSAQHGWPDLAAHLRADDILLLTSPAALQYWLALAGEKALSPRWLVVSPRLAKQAHELGARVVVAAGADNAALLAALQTHI